MSAMRVPLVSCIMPTYNRREFIPHAIRYFLRQDYENKELIVIDDGQDNIQDLIPDLPCIRYYRLPQKITLGAKLNLACRYAAGDIIANWDDDDWYAPWRLQYQIKSLLDNNTQVCGINTLLYFDLGSKAGYQYIYPSNQRVWLLGSSLCFTKTLWAKNQFADINVGMDGLFVWNTPAEKVSVLSQYDFSVHMIHRDNVSPKNTSGAWWHPYSTDKIKRIMSDDWQYYTNGHITYPSAPDYGLQLTKYKKELPAIKNVYACLVHEQPDCILDLVENLHYNDPESTILLYNGGTNSNLVPENFPLRKYNAVRHPAPRPVKHGYLHDFALRSMQYMLEGLDNDILTIVDSDQLSIKPGYTVFMSSFFSNLDGRAGMLSSNPLRVDRNNKTNNVALQAFREFDLWKPLLAQFEGGEDHFVHWTFWPSTVFTKDACKDLLQLFNTNATLQEIMRHTKIWASEEVILPTLVKLLGYDICANPCSYNLVRYRQDVHTDELNKAFLKPDMYWVHPVPRSTHDPIRKFIRGKFNEYVTETERQPITMQHADVGYDIQAALDKMRNTQGWLSESEARLLANCCIHSLQNADQLQYIVETGCYHGKSTVLLGTIVKDLFPNARIASVDPHDGKLGAVDQGLKKYPPSLNEFKKNILGAGLTEIVEVIQERAANVQWQQPISLLFIDGLHDYQNVSSDFSHFAPFLIKDGYVAFHDYAGYFPGVTTFVDELLSGGKYCKVQKNDSLIVLMKK
ncbi:glycosyltransferase [Danxiaibacter flavus]|uniref:Glycosyltransferase n=1 Tax=Danxiaibacter flavus TaxID=3049108 RepID=A0ABV3ZIC2_9BACT|nr:glycosyltransferase [Chitinophagaceae bacterium DXS]